MRRLLALPLAASTWTSCLARPPDPPDAAIDTSRAFEVLAVSVRDSSGKSWPLENAPREPLIEVTLSAPLTQPETSIFLLAAPDAPSLREDLTRSPVRVETLARAVASPEPEGDRIVFRPGARAPGETLVLALGAWASDPQGDMVGSPWVQEITISRESRAGARAIAAWPPDGAYGIGTSLSFAAVLFDGEVTDAQGVLLEDSQGHVVPTRNSVEDCPEFGAARAVDCVRLLPRDLLSSQEEYVLQVRGARDATGAVVPTFSARFRTAPLPDLTAPSFRALSCGVDELDVEIGCALAEEDKVTLRTNVEEPALASVKIAGQEFWAAGSRGDLEVRLTGLEPAAHYDALLEVRDASGNIVERSLRLETTPPLPRVSITEILADPHGPEPQQEFVELWNASDEMIDLEDWSLSDTPNSEGDRFENTQPLPPGARLLVVGANFDPDEHAMEDASIPPGTILLRTGDASIASGGLANRGESLYLRDATGRRISAAPRTPTPREGVCVVRIGTDLRTADPSSFDYDAEGTCTPGR